MCSKFWALYEYKAQIMRTSRYTTWGPGEELGGTQQSLILGGSIIARSSPLPFYIPFLIEKVPLLCTFHLKMVPLLHTIASLLTAENALFFEIWVNQSQNPTFFQLFRSQKIHLLALAGLCTVTEMADSTTLSYTSASYIPTHLYTWSLKKVPFQARPPCRGHL